MKPVALGVTLAATLAWAQLTVDTVAGGAIPSGLPSQKILSGTVAGITQDTAGNTYLCDAQLAVIQRIRPDGIMETFAGNGVPGFAGDGGTASSASLQAPQFCTLDSQGNLLFADSGRIRQIDPSGTITTIAGTGIIAPGVLGNADSAIGAPIGLVNGLAADQSGNVYFSEYSTNRIRRVTPDGRIEVFAGAEHQLGVASSGDGGPALSAVLAGNQYLTIDGADNLYFGDGASVRRISPDGIITTVVGGGTDSTAHDGVPATSASLFELQGLTADPAGNLYLTDSFQSQFSTARIRRVDTNGTLSTIAGAPAPGNGVDGPALSVILQGATSLFADFNGAVWFFESVTHRVRQVSSGLVVSVTGVSVMHAPDGVAGRDAWLVDPISIAVSHSGDLYLGEGRDCSIRRLSVDGTLTTVPGTGNCSTGLPIAPQYLAVDSLGRLYAGTGAVFSISPSGDVAEIPNLQGGYGLAIDSNDRLYSVAGQNVYRLLPDGTQQWFLGFGGGIVGFWLRSPLGGIAVDPSDNVYIADDFGGYGTIYCFRPDGSALFAAPVLPFSNAMAVDQLGNVWQTGYNTIAALGPSLNFRSQNYGFSGDGGPLQNAAFKGPGSLAVAPDGSIYVNDSGNRRIRKISGPLSR